MCQHWLLGQESHWSGARKTYSAFENIDAISIFNTCMYAYYRRKLQIKTEWYPVDNLSAFINVNTEKWRHVRMERTLFLFQTVHFLSILIFGQGCMLEATGALFCTGPYVRCFMKYITSSKEHITKTPWSVIVIISSMRKPTVPEVKGFMGSKAKKEEDFQVVWSEFKADNPPTSLQTPPLTMCGQRHKLRAPSGQEKPLETWLTRPPVC